MLKIIYILIIFFAYMYISVKHYIKGETFWLFFDKIPKDPLCLHHQIFFFHQFLNQFVALNQTYFKYFKTEKFSVFSISRRIF